MIIEFIVVFGVLELYMSVGFIVAHYKNDNSIVDPMYGIGFIVSTISSLLLGSTFLPRQILLSILVTLWGLRLGIYLLIRNWGNGEDYRYTNMKKTWKNAGKSVVLNSFLRVFLFQGILIYLINFPVLYSNLIVTSDLNFLDGVGLVIWIIGFFFESVGDAQLRHFKKDPNNKGKVFNKGLWRYTRHPNYFGEATMWWGIFVINVSNPMGYLNIFSALLITFLLLKVSGVVLLEKRYEGSPEYITYQKQTSGFFPRPPRKIDQI